MIEKVEWLELGGKKHPLVFTLGAMKIAYEKYGDIKGLFKALTTEHTVLDTAIDMILVLNRQGCAYLNMFGKDAEYPDDVEIVDGQFVPIEREMLELMLTFDDGPELTKRIDGAFVKSQKKKIEGKSTKKTRAVSSRTT